MYIKFLQLILLPVLVFTQYLPTICLDNEACYKGSWINTQKTRFASFQGIRYGHPPIGDLRFKSPHIYNAEVGIHDVSSQSNVACLQLEQYTTGIKGQEDCLMLNIYVPEIVFTNETILPVMFFIHGGSLILGSNNFDLYGPQNFMEKEVVVVTINYRLGPLGFLTLGTEFVPGNAGLRDQNLALSWVKKNIDKFGGNPDAVTIFGQSSGAFSVAMHLMSPLSEGLFHRAILQSGTALEPGWGPITLEPALQYADMFSKALGCDPDQADDVLFCLQSKEITDILDLTNLMGGNSIWTAVPDADFISVPFFTGDADQLMASGQFNTEVDVIIGTNADEGIASFFNVILDSTLWDDIRNNFDTYGPKHLFNIANQSDIMPEDVEKAHKILEYYVGSIDNINEDHMQGMFDMLTDANFLYGTYKTINHLVRYGVTVYQYILSYEGQFSWSQLHGIDDPMGVCHCDDLYYLWNPVLGMELHLPEEDMSVREVMVTAWSNFAIYGDPTPQDSGLSWTESDSDLRYWNISGPLPCMDSSKEIQERMLLWDQVVGQNSSFIPSG